MKTTINLSVFLLCLLLQTVYSNINQFSNDQLIPGRLPYNMIEFSPPNYIFSGFRTSYLVNLQDQSFSQVLTLTESLCATSPADNPFYSRLFLKSLTEAYYYCPNLNILYRINPSNNFIYSGEPIGLHGVPKFNEVKFTLSPTNTNILFMLGLVNSPNLKNVTANNFTASYLVQFDLGAHLLINSSTITGAHNEPIVGLETMSNGEAVAIGEKLYGTQQKLNTFYLGNLGDTYFNRVIDFYLANSYGYIPKIKIMMNDTYVLYTNDKDIFRYNKNSGQIFSYPGISFVANEFVKIDGSKIDWSEVPMTISPTNDSIYIYNQGNFVNLGVMSMAPRATTPVPVNMSNYTYTQFYFFQQGTQDQVLLQLDDHSTLFALN